MENLHAPIQHTPTITWVSPEPYSGQSVCTAYTMLTSSTPSVVIIPGSLLTSIMAWAAFISREETLI